MLGLWLGVALASSFFSRGFFARDQVVGDLTAGVPPVPIPNTEVKPRRADGTARESVWERRSLPAFNKGHVAKAAWPFPFTDGCRVEMCGAGTHARCSLPLIVLGGGAVVSPIDGTAIHGTAILIAAAAWGLAFLLAGLAEEFLFRGYAQFTLTTGMGFWPTAFLLSGLFGLVHASNGGEAISGIWVVSFGVVVPVSPPDGKFMVCGRLSSGI